MELMAEARRNPVRVPVALIWFGVVPSAAALALIVFGAPGGVFLGAVMVFGLGEASFGSWVVPRDLDGWQAAGKTLLWISLLPLLVVHALGGLSFLK